LNPNRRGVPVDNHPPVTTHPQNPQSKVRPAEQRWIEHPRIEHFWIEHFWIDPAFSTRPRRKPGKISTSSF
jgi:hypothetical protein